MARIVLPSPLASRIDARDPVDAAGGTAGEVLRRLERDHPPLAGFALDERGALRPHVQLFLGSGRIDLAALLAPADELTVVTAGAGHLGGGRMSRCGAWTARAAFPRATPRATRGARRSSSTASPHASRQHRPGTTPGWRGIAAIPALAGLAVALLFASPLGAAPSDVGVPRTASAARGVPSPASPHAPALAAARAWRGEHGAAILAGFAELLAIPNVAADLPNVRANAEAIAELLRRRGATMEVLGLPDAPAAPPIVWGRLAADARGGASRTLVLYLHYDGQPVDPEEWTFPPWRPTLVSAALTAGGEERPLPAPGEPIDPEWRLYARSAGDDKAPITAILAALDGLAAAGVARTADLVFFFEGEEEAGSPHLARYVDRYADRLAADLWLFLDGPVHQTGRPQLFFGVRGYAGFELTVYGAERQLHSGHYGNFAPNPVAALARLVASFEDGEGRVAIEGFYDSAEPLGEAERQALAAIPPFEEALLDELGLAASEGGGARYSERIALPALNARGIAGGAVGEKAVNAIPPQATASFDVRLVSGDDPQAMLDLVAAHVRRQGYHLVAEEPTPEERRRHPKLARFVPRVGYPAVRTPIDLPVAREVVAAANAAAGEPVILLPTLGGSLPLHVFRAHLEAPLVGVPIANHDNNQHAADENLRLGNLWYGIDLLAAILAAP